MSVWRDLYAGDVRPDHVGQELTVAGWVARRRDHGGLIFIDLRDHTGIVQLVVNPERAPEAAETAHDIRSEFVVRAQGEVVRRAPDAVTSGRPDSRTVAWPPFTITVQPAPRRPAWVSCPLTDRRA